MIVYFNKVWLCYWEKKYLKRTKAQKYSLVFLSTLAVNMVTFRSSYHLSKNQKTDAVCQSTNCPKFRPIRTQDVNGGWAEG